MKINVDKNRSQITYTPCSIIINLIEWKFLRNSIFCKRQKMAFSSIHKFIIDFLSLNVKIFIDWYRFFIAISKVFNITYYYYEFKFKKFLYMILIVILRRENISSSPAGNLTSLSTDKHVPNTLTFEKIGEYVTSPYIPNFLFWAHFYGLYIYRFSKSFKFTC